MSAYEASSLFVSVATLFIMIGAAFIAWGKMQGWKEKTDDDIEEIHEDVKKIEDRLNKGDSYIGEGKQCLDEVDSLRIDFNKLENKLISSDGTPTYITTGVCKMYQKQLCDNISLKMTISDGKIEALKESLSQLSKSIDTQISRMITILEGRNENIGQK